MSDIVIAASPHVKEDVPVEVIHSHCRGAVAAYRARQAGEALGTPIVAARAVLLHQVNGLGGHQPPLTKADATRITVAVLAAFLRAEGV